MSFKTAIPGLLSAVLIVAGVNPAQAASHREAPLIASDPAADNTDVYLFRSWEDPSKVVFIMNVNPGQNPADGPNYFNFGDDVVYRFNIDNNRDGKADDVIYEFRFTTENRTLAAPLAYVSVTPLGIPQITALDRSGSEGILRRQKYSVAEIRGTTPTVLGSGLIAVPSNVGLCTMPNYPALASQGIYDVGNGIRVFAGQRAETFYIDLGATFDSLNLQRTPLPLLTKAEDANDGANAFGVNRFKGANISTIALEVPISRITRDGQPANSTNRYIGLYASTSRAKFKVLRNTGNPSQSGPLVQVSRMANPLVNELIINTPSKDFWNAQEPEDEAQFQAMYQQPVVAVVFQAIFGVPVTPPPNTVRTDLMSILLKYAGQPLGANSTCGSPCSELLRLDLTVPPTAPANQKRLGPFAHDAATPPNSTPDPAGWPNGRRPNDDVTDIVIRVVGGTNYINNYVGDGINFLELPFGTPDVTTNGIAMKFPFLPVPFPGGVNTCNFNQNKNP